MDKTTTFIAIDSRLPGSTSNLVKRRFPSEARRTRVAAEYRTRGIPLLVCMVG